MPWERHPRRSPHKEGGPHVRDPYAIPPKDRAVEGIEWLIHSQELGAGDRLPVERELSRRLGVSRTALRAGIAILVSQHELESRQGSGTYVCARKPQSVFQCSGSFSDTVREAGMRPGSRVLEARITASDEGVANHLGIAAGAAIFVLRRMRTADDEPVGIETTRVNVALCPDIDRHDFSRESLYAVLEEEYGIIPVRGYQRVSITQVNEGEADVLGARVGEPAFFERSLARTEDGVTVEYVTSVILPSRYRFASVEDETDDVHVEVNTAWLRS